MPAGEMKSRPDSKKRQKPELFSRFEKSSFGNEGSELRLQRASSARAAKIAPKSSGFSTFLESAGEIISPDESKGHSF